MKRMHIHVAVENLDDSIRFYSAMFGNASRCPEGRLLQVGTDETDAELAEMNARICRPPVYRQLMQPGEPVSEPAAASCWIRNAIHVRNACRSVRSPLEESNEQH